MPKRPVRRGDGYIQRAKQMFPVGGSPAGSPSYSQFQDGPEAAAMAQFSLAFDDLPDAVEGVAIRAVMTADVPLFGPMVFFGVLGDDGAVELVDVIFDPDYFDLIDGDPEG